MIVNAAGRSPVGPFFFHCPDHHRDVHSFPTRRSSDLSPGQTHYWSVQAVDTGFAGSRFAAEQQFSTADRKSTRLNSSHVEISYAVFCLKKKRKPSSALIHQRT